MLGLIGKIIAGWFGEALYFPLWWYSQGFLGLSAVVFGYLGNEFQALAIKVWLTNLFVPMYGQHDFASRLISFFMRLVQIFFRFIYWLVLVCLALSLLLLWLAAPVLALVALITQLI
ncbi:MAG: hypothetical protein WCO55_03825 [Candidatus Falkowbacteria bacterium]